MARLAPPPPPGERRRPGGRREGKSEWRHTIRGGRGGSTFQQRGCKGAKPHLPDSIYCRNKYLIPSCSYFGKEFCTIFFAHRHHTKIQKLFMWQKIREICLKKCAKHDWMYRLAGEPWTPWHAFIIIHEQGRKCPTMNATDSSMRWRSYRAADLYKEKISRIRIRGWTFRFKIPKRSWKIIYWLIN